MSPSDQRRSRNTTRNLFLLLLPPLPLLLHTPPAPSICSSPANDAGSRLPSAVPSTPTYTAHTPDSLPSLLLPPLPRFPSRSPLPLLHPPPPPGPRIRLHAPARLSPSATRRSRCLPPCTPTALPDSSGPAAHTLLP